MLVEERQRLIIDIVEKNRFSSVEVLCSELNISAATIRRDIRALSHLGLVKKIRGGAEAVYNFKHPFNLHSNKKIEKKICNRKLIAKAAAGLCGNNDSIIINGGKLTNFMGEYLVDKQLNVMTNSMLVAQSLWNINNNQVVLPGGQVYGSNGIIIEDFQTDNNNSPNYYYSKKFVSTEAISQKGVMESDRFIAKAEYQLNTQAEKLIVMAESSTLGMTSNFVCSRIDEVDVLITDNDANKDILQEFTDIGVEVVKAI